jgi:sugar phosphate isomerase/epimerase
LRDIFRPDPAAALDKAKALGFTEVETFSNPTPAPAELRKMLDARGLKAVSGHFGYDMFEKDLPKVIESAKALGLEYTGIAWIPHGTSFGMADVEKAAGNFNKWGAELAKHGLKFFYHCHGYEFGPVSAGEKKTFMDVLMEKTDANTVAFEMDIFWVVLPGADPVHYLNAYPGRWQLVHLKDISKKAGLGVMTGKISTEFDVTIGTGQVKWPAVLAAAAKSGVKHYFIEDESPAAVTQIPESLKYLQSLK